MSRGFRSGPGLRFADDEIIPPPQPDNDWGGSTILDNLGRSKPDPSDIVQYRHNWPAARSAPAGYVTPQPAARSAPAGYVPPQPQPSDRYGPYSFQDSKRDAEVPVEVPGLQNFEVYPRNGVDDSLYPLIDGGGVLDLTTDDMKPDPNQMTTDSNVDRFLVVVSFVMLAVAILSRWGMGKSLTVPLWDVMVVFDSGAGGAPASSAVNALRTKLVDWCPDYGMKDLALVPMYGMNAFPVTTINHSAIDLWLLIFVMIGVTLGFQLYRSSDGYNPKGPAVGRWFEYALTSPLMLIVVALSFHIREQSTLYCLGALQLLMVVVGFSIEREIQLFYKQAGHEGKSIVKKKGFQLLYAASLLAHACIWYTIIARWLRESQAVDDCTFENVRKFTNETKNEEQYKQMNGIIQALVFSQCALFSLYAFMPYVTCMLLDKCNTEEDQERAWRTSAVNYSCLSVFCKSVLIIIFIVYASKVPEIYSHKLDVEVDPRCHVACAAPAPTPAPPPPYTGGPIYMR